MTYPNSAPLPMPSRPVAPADPIRAYMSSSHPGVTPDGRHIVIPVGILETLPLPVQQQVVHALAQVHQVPAPWPVYRVQAARWARLCDLTEPSLAEVGVIPEMDLGGEMVYRDQSTGRGLSSEEMQRRVLVSAPDPLAGSSPAIPR